LLLAPVRHFDQTTQKNIAEGNDAPRQEMQSGGAEIQPLSH
jgi:hypothetical protein